MVVSNKNNLIQRIAYFSMEIALSNGIRTYSGGLGILAGDTIRSSADLKLPLVAVTLLSKKGFFKKLKEFWKDGREKSKDRVSIKLRDR